MLAVGRGKKRGVEAEVEKQRDTQRYTETHTHTQTHTHTLSLSLSTSFVRTTIDGCHQVSTSGTVQEFEPGWAFDAAAAPHHPAPCCAQPAPRVSSRLCTWTERLCVCVCICMSVSVSVSYSQTCTHTHTHTHVWHCREMGEDEFDDEEACTICFTRPIEGVFVRTRVCLHHAALPVLQPS